MATKKSQSRITGYIRKQVTPTKAKFKNQNKIQQAVIVGQEVVSGLGVATRGVKTAHNATIGKAYSKVSAGASKFKQTRAEKRRDEAARRAKAKARRIKHEAMVAKAKTEGRYEQTFDSQGNPKGCRIRAHTRTLQSGKIVKVKGHTRT